MSGALPQTSDISWPIQAALETRILVADDDPILREFAIVHLSAPHVEVEVAEDGLFALERLKQGGIDLALVDLDMPRMNGFELIQAIREDRDLAHLPIVVVTGREDMEAVDRAYQAGATSFAVKPLNWRLLSHQLAYVLRNSRNENEVRLAKVIAEQGANLKTNLLRLLRHELNTPMNAILGFGKLIADHASEPASQSHARHILNAARQLKKVNDSISEAASALAGEVAPNIRSVGVADLLKSGARLALGNGGKATDLKLIDRTHQGECYADPEMISACLNHLITNGLVHGFAPIVISAAMNSDETVSFVVEDHGEGLGEEQMAQHFEPMQSTNQVMNHGGKAGLGLGLAIVHAYIQGHGGEVQLAKSAFGGLRAEIRLPLKRSTSKIQQAA
jgi:signal transduction histidine kinase